VSDLNTLVMQALSNVIEPELHRDIVSLNMVRNLSIQGDVAKFTIVLTTPACPLKNVFLERCQDAVVGKVAGIQAIEIQWDAEVPKGRSLPNQTQSPANILIAVASGKGGVGKSTVATNVAVALSEMGAEVGLIDADILNPNIQTMTGLDTGRPLVEDGKMVPLKAFGVKLMSTGFLTTPDRPMILRGPMLHSAIRQFFDDVHWGKLDYMVVDLPPGTGDAPLSLAQHFPLTGAVIVTQPQDVAVSDARRSVAMFKQLNVPIIGIVENMAGEFFGIGGGENLAKELSVPFLGRVPLASSVRMGGDYGRPVVLYDAESESARALTHIAQAIAARASLLIMQSPNVIPINIIG